MDKEQAKFILQCFRPDGGDALDTDFAEALGLATKDRELGEWLVKERSTDAAFAAALESVEIPEFWRNNLAAGQMIDGPAFIAEDDTTTVVDRGWRVVVDARGYLNLERTEAV